MIANGTVSGSDSMMIKGYSHDSNCAASTRYMKTTARKIANMNAFCMRAISLLRPNGSAV